MTNREENQFLSRRNFLKSTLASAVGLAGIVGSGALTGCGPRPYYVKFNYEGIEVFFEDGEHADLIHLIDKEGNNINYTRSEAGKFNSLYFNVKPGSDLEKYICLEKLNEILKHVESKTEEAELENSGEQK